jgi:hypothetical protein
MATPISATESAGASIFKQDSCEIRPDKRSYMKHQEVQNYH